MCKRGAIADGAVLRVCAPGLGSGRGLPRGALTSEPSAAECLFEAPGEG